MYPRDRDESPNETMNLNRGPDFRSSISVGNVRGSFLDVGTTKFYFFHCLMSNPVLARVKRYRG